MKEKTREQKQASGFFAKGFTYNGVKFEKLSLGRMGVLMRVNSPFINGGEKFKATYDALYVCSMDLDELTDIVDAGLFEKGVYKFMDKFTIEDHPKLEALVYNVSEEIASAMVEVRGEDDDGKK